MTWSGNRETAQQARALALLAESGLIPTIHMETQSPLTPVSGDLTPSSGL